MSAKPVKFRHSLTRQVHLPEPNLLPGPGETIQAEFRGLSTADKDALGDFFKTAARGMAEPWTYVDPAGHELTVRFDEPALCFVGYDRAGWDVSVVLRIVGGGV